jgi:hypothetical protein
MAMCAMTEGIARRASAVVWVRTFRVMMYVELRCVVVLLFCEEKVERVVRKDDVVEVD